MLYNLTPISLRLFRYNSYSSVMRSNLFQDYFKQKPKTLNLCGVMC